MLIYETEGFLEVESEEIKQLCRSKAAVPFGDTGSEAYEVQVALCDYLDNSESRCCVAFHVKTLKRSLIFAVKGTEKQSSWQYGQELLVRLGFQLEDINLKLSPAMQEVVLRDVPGLLSPAEARKQRTEKELLLTELQNTYDKAPDSVQGRRAALKLSAVKLLNDRSEELRLFLELMLSQDESARADLEVFTDQLEDLTAKLEAAEARAEVERKQREMSESITLAAEKRIQELEEILVDVETKSAEALKQKRKAVQLRKRIKDLGAELESAKIETEKEREKQEQFIADVKVANEQITLLEDSLTEAESSLASTKAQWEEEQAEKVRLSECFKEAELRIKALDKELEDSEKKVNLCDEAVKSSEDIQAQLAEVQQELKAALDLNEEREEALVVAARQSEELEKRLQEAEKTGRGKMSDKEQEMITLTEKKEQLTRELEDLRDEYNQECNLRKRLEKDSAKDDKRIQELEDTIAELTQQALALTKVGVGTEKETETETETGGEEVAREVTSLKIELQEQEQRLKEEQQSREGLETELHETHKLIDSLEKMVKETEQSPAEKPSSEASAESDSRKVQELMEKLKSVENQLEQERVEHKKLAKAVTVAEKKLVDQEKRAAEQEKKLAQAQVEHKDRKIPEAVVDEEPVIQKRVKSSKPLPHELRTAPRKGAFFHPDWDLEGLPCQSSEQVFKAWETVFNVQISLEGYSSQYCMAFMVVLRLGKQKKLYMLYRLKKDKHTLVCVPAKTLKDEASLKKAIKEGLKFLKMSGFEMEEMAAENIDSTLGGYFLGV